jgi:hypothetical protein
VISFEVTAWSSLAWIAASIADFSPLTDFPRPCATWASDFPPAS